MKREGRCNTLEITKRTDFATPCGHKFNISFPLKIAYGIEIMATILQRCDSISNLMRSLLLAYKDIWGNMRWCVNTIYSYLSIYLIYNVNLVKVALVKNLQAIVHHR